jgi:hypothetical protein
MGSQGGTKPRTTVLELDTEDIVGIRHQATTHEGTIGWEDLVRSVVK